jgi:VIT1/CCC1 family predicted Fe2+/Mn2+ transporter
MVKNKIGNRLSEKFIEKFEFFGKSAFFVGTMVAIISAFMGPYASSKVVVISLTILGLFVGFFNISRKGNVNFLIAVISLVVFSLAGIEITSIFGQTFEGYLILVFRNYTIFVASAGFVVAKRVIFSSRKGY